VIATQRLDAGELQAYDVRIPLKWTMLLCAFTLPAAAGDRVVALLLLAGFFYLAKGQAMHGLAVVGSLYHLNEKFVRVFNHVDVAGVAEDTQENQRAGEMIGRISRHEVFQSMMDWLRFGVSADGAALLTFNSL
jgi:hypothetical protein